MFISPVRASFLLLFAAPAAADVIYLTDGSAIEDVSIDEETVTSVTYKDDRRVESVPSDRVARVEFTSRPELIDTAATALHDGELMTALEDLAAYVDAVRDGSHKERKKYSWAPPYAANEVVQLAWALGDPAGVVEYADFLIAKYPESRYVPNAYLKKAAALVSAEKGSEANEAQTAFSELIDSKALSARWRLECDLALVLTDDGLKGKARRDALNKVEVSARSDFPVVSNRAKLARGESLVADAQESSGNKQALLDEAKKIFEDVIADVTADDETRAGAYTGLGDTIFFAGDRSAERLREAGMNYLRVAVLFKDQGRYVPRALFYAGRCFDQSDELPDKRRARQLYQRVVAQYPESAWRQQAESHLR